MPAFFSLALAPTLRRIQARLHPDDTVVAYLDDIYLILFFLSTHPSSLSLFPIIVIAARNHFQISRSRVDDCHKICIIISVKFLFTLS